MYSAPTCALVSGTLVAAGVDVTSVVTGATPMAEEARPVRPPAIKLAESGARVVMAVETAVDVADVSSTLKKT